MNKSKDLWVHSGNLLPTLNFIFTFSIAIYLIIGNQFIPSIYLLIFLTVLLYVINPIISEKFSRKKLDVIKKSEYLWEITSENPAKHPEYNFLLNFETTTQISMVNRYPEFHLVIEKENGFTFTLSERMNLLRRSSLIHFATFITKKAAEWNKSHGNKIKIKDNLKLKSLPQYLSNKYFIYLVILVTFAVSISIVKLLNNNLNILLITIIVLIGLRLSIAIAFYYKIVSEQDFGKELVLDDEIEW